MGSAESAVVESIRPIKLDNPQRSIVAGRGRPGASGASHAIVSQPSRLRSRVSDSAKLGPKAERSMTRRAWMRLIVVESARREIRIADRWVQNA